MAHDTKTGSYGIVALPDVSAFPGDAYGVFSFCWLIFFLWIDIEVADGFATQEANEARINNMLDQVLDGVIDLKYHQQKKKGKKRLIFSKGNLLLLWELRFSRRTRSLTIWTLKLGRRTFIWTLSTQS